MPKKQQQMNNSRVVEYYATVEEYSNVKTAYF